MSNFVKIRFRCSNCGKLMSVASKYAGRLGRCPGCGDSVKIPTHKEILDKSTKIKSVGHSACEEEKTELKIKKVLSAESTKSEPEKKRDINCKKCGEPLRQIYKSGQPTKKRFCPKCQAKPGICPFCQQKLETKQTQFCPICYRCWHRWIPEALPLLPKIPPKDSKSHIEIIIGGKIIRYDTLDLVREHLLEGKLGRFHLNRWIEPKPELQGNSERDRDIYKQKYSMWDERRKWRAIGEGMAKEQDSIQMLYEPRKVFFRWGFYIAFLAFIILQLPIAIKIGESWALKPDDWFIVRNAGVSDFPEVFVWMFHTRLGRTIFLFSIGSIAIPVIARIAGTIFSPFIGSLIGAVKEDSVPVPPDDGYESWK